MSDQTAKRRRDIAGAICAIIMEEYPFTVRACDEIEFDDVDGAWLPIADRIIDLFDSTPEPDEKEVCLRGFPPIGYCGCADCSSTRLTHSTFADV